MPVKLEEITVIYLRERVRREQWAVSEVRLVDGDGYVPQMFAIVGDSDPGEFVQGLTYRVYGSWDHSSEKFGPQFRHKTFVRAQPHGRRGTIRYLCECRNIGTVTAGKLWDKFQGDAVRILRESPDVAAAAIGSRFTQEHATEAAEDLRRMQALEDVTIELMDLLDGRSFPKGAIREAIRMWGNRAVEFLRRNPYLAQVFRGVGFKRADAFYLDLGHPPAKLKRQAYCIAYEVVRESETNGHTWVPVAKAVEHLRATIGGTEVTPEKALALALRAKILRSRIGAGGEMWIADERKAAAEEYVARHVVDAFDSEQQTICWPSLSEACFNSLTDHQREQLEKAIAGPLGILGGGPGTGKTYSIARLIRSLIREHGQNSIAVCCPTGKAAVRCREALAENGVTEVEPKTIHRTLGVESADGGWTFRHDGRNPLPHKFIIVDEVSMVGTGLLRSLLAARNRGTGVLFVGDPEQLSPVEYGAPLRDMIAAGLPYGELTEIHRNAGSIVRACKAIREGRPFETDEQVDLQAEPPRNLILIPASKTTAPLKVLSMLRKIRDDSPFDAVWETMTVVAVNKRSPLSRRVLNPQIQGELNQSGDATPGSPFRTDDKLIQLENQFLQLDGRLASTTGGEKNENKVLCCNGEFARTVEVHAKKTIVEFAEPTRRVVVPRGAAKEKQDNGKDDTDDNDTGCRMDLGYAITAHKSQGSGVPVVIVCLDEYAGASGPYGVCDRSWLYTAISRAEKLCILVGTMSTATRICSRRFVWRRKTFLVELLREFGEKAGVAFTPRMEDAIDIW